ncbi:ribosome-associated translation inhibitor RaiA [Candidatus Falkowbacteria bacterium]|jgi:putative sigma-54 modulation protein|nr:ribosome-associated translation inhibitor RaiA [Candidatus Falkowbacteria bacterium]MBT5503249.1 ribosome-associated translation inhibitor RaiA [Candidatus Falkowbacteria bacterium]MBT6574248.1 ribosome-associated translation inhibitor RaiA [Candidatus Falkowbacteria bacterium]MBT7348152.1 ribosome-associated translation inhibitor RaiA [Candidatus Falkowbacteria bacterium]MBT7500787.1 ribosome-associated translation inhibitor RaiA [Candidatus Falkowbacteria bacterium]
MKINLKAKNLELTAQIKDHVDQKIGGLEKYFNNIQQIDVEVGKTKANQQKGDIFFCEVNVSVPKKLLRFRKEFGDVMKAINEAKKGIQNEITKYKRKSL